MKTLLLSFFITTVASAAIKIAPGTYESDRCFVEVTKTSQGGSYVEIATKANDNSLERDIIVVDAKGDLVDGPGLCSDEVTMGRNWRSQVSILTLGSNGVNTTEIKCGGFGFPITVNAKIITNAKNELTSFTEKSATKQLLFKKERSMDCGKLKLIK